MKLPAGKYFVGDPCYVYFDEWSNYCEHFFASENGHFVVNDVSLFCANTMHGDGEYNDKHGNSYSVDAGMIGATHESAWNVTDDRIKKRGLGQIVEFDKPFECSFSAGVIYIGHIVIDTDEYDEDEFCPECDMYYEECVCGECDEYDDEGEY